MRCVCCVIGEGEGGEGETGEEGGGAPGDQRDILLSQGGGGDKNKETEQGERERETSDCRGERWLMMER